MNMYVRIVIGAVVGAGVGFAMYRFVGCKTGTCPMTANPWIYMVIFGLMGAMAVSGR